MYSNDKRMDINCSNYPSDSVSWHPHFTGYYRLCVTPIIAVLGILGNAIVILVFLLEHKKSRFSIYCMAISSTHIIILLTNSLMDDFMGSGLKYWKKGYEVKFDRFSNSTCKVMEYVPNCMYTASSGLLLVFSIDRIVTIFKPMQFYSIHFRKFSIYLCLSVVMMSSILTIPLLISSNVKRLSGDNLKCTTNDQGSVGQAAILIKVFLTFVIPTFIIFILNIVICLKLWKAKIQRARLLPGDLQKNNLEMNRICGHLALNTVFLLFTFPLVCSMLMRRVNACSGYNKSLSHMFSSIKDISYSLDFLLYFVFLTNFRWRFIRYLVAPLFRCGFIRKSTFGIYMDSKLLKYDSNSSRRKYSAIAAAFSSSNNQHMFSVLMYRTSGNSSSCRPFYGHYNSCNSADLYHTPVATPSIKERCASVPRQKTVSYAMDAKTSMEEAMNLIKE